jgi:L1 cell adhesion molecule like protein
METSPAIEIDVGTTYSRVSVFQRGKVKVIANEQGNRTTPSHEAFKDTKGTAAKDQETRKPRNRIFGKFKL